MPVQNFGYKNAWLAIRAQQSEVVRAVVAEAAPADWAAGLVAAYDWPSMTYGEAIFISPSLDGWVLCVGTGLAAFSDSTPPVFGELAHRLALELNAEVQYFATHRVVEAHAWAKATPAGVVRAFSYLGESGETLLDIGHKTEAEAQVTERPSESDVMHVAASWSVDPSELESRFPDAPDGMLGRLTIEKPPPPAPRQPSVPSEPLRPWWKVW